MGDLLKITGSAGRKEGHRVLQMDGPLTLETVPAFLKVVRAETATVVVLDMAAVGIIDSAGVGGLIQTHVAYSKAQRKLLLTGVNARNMAVFEITRVAKAFYIFPSVQEAEAAV